MVQLSIRDVLVDFPFNPYPCQTDYMEKVLEALQTGSNALLESPTGTGKTLCLLCASLAWQLHEKNRRSTKISIGYNLPPHIGPSVPNNSSTTSPCTKIIIYASRTHSQLTQVINELKSTVYVPKMTVMASRDQLCINDRLLRSTSSAATHDSGREGNAGRSFRGGVLNHACNKMSSQRSCLFKNNLDTYTGSGECGSTLLDIEGLVNLGRQDSICPYFYSRENATRSELVLLPYNYLMDSSIRSTLRGVNWQDACVIIDEAHNLEQIASDASSFTLTTNDLTECIRELQNVIRLLQLHQNTIPSDQQQQGKAAAKTPTDPGGSHGDKPNIQQCALILRSLFSLEDRISKLELLNSKSGPVSLTDGTKCLVLPGSWFVTTLAEVGLLFENCVRTIDELKLASDFLMDDVTAALGGVRTGAVSEPKLSHLSHCFAKIYKGRDMADCVRHTVDYSVFIQEEASKLGKQGKKIINYWCFSPGVAMEELKRLGVRSIILTSGTLSPMEAFREDLKIPFTVQLENPHVIGQHQVWISAIGTGPNSKILNSSYERRDNPEYKDELGFSILSICRSMRGLPVNHQNVNLTGGILVFFPTYGTMESAVTRWRTTGLWDDLCQVAGHIVTENKGSENVVRKKNAKSLYDSTEKTNFVISREDHQMGTIEEFETALQRRGTCLLLAVCRGKVSEGIDFRDSKGRIVIITGIPYAPHLDPRIVLKKKHLDDSLQSKGNSDSTELTPQAQAMRMLSGTSSAAFSSPSLRQNKISGQSWYVQSACRAVNQAMGRVIRHHKDWGAIFLLDARFAAEKQSSQLSRWLRPRLKKLNFFPAIQSFREFCTAALTNPELQPSMTPQEPRGVIRDSRAPYHPQETSAKQMKKEVVIHAAELKETDEAGLDGYIDPKLLLSQNSFQKKQSSAMNLSAPFSRENQTESSDNDVSLILSQVKSITTLNQATTSSSVAPEKRSIADLFSKSATEISSSTTKSTNKVLNPSQLLLVKSENTLSAKLREKATAPIPGSASSIVRSESKRTIGLHSTDCYSASLDDSSKPSSQPLSQSGIRSFFSQEYSQSTSSSTNDSQVAASQVDQKSKKSLFKQLIAQLQTKLSPPSFNQLMIEIKKIAAISREHGGISEVGQIRQFINDMMRVLAPELPPSQLKHSMEIFGTLFPENHLELYSTIVEKSIQFHAATKDSSSQSSNTHKTSKLVPGNELLTSIPHATALSAELAQDSRASKRAKMMQTSATQQVLSTSKSLLSTVDGISLSRQNSILGSSDDKHLKRLCCVICRENPPRHACAAPCGHICCQTCWEEWLKLKAECPFCRCRTVSSDLARIRVAP